MPSEPGEGPSPSPLLAWDDAAAAAAWVGPVLAFLPGGMPEAMGGLGAACRGARAAVVRCVFLWGMYGWDGSTTCVGSPYPVSVPIRYPHIR